MLPNFLIIGAQKSGTTSLYRYLQLHPDVFMPRRKEPDFFVAERRWPMGLDWYEAHFAAAGDAVAIGEASTTYTMHPHYAGVPERIADVLGAPKLVYLLRDPIDRARSDYLHYRFPPESDAREFFDREHRSIREALLENPLYLDTSRYAMQLERYFEVFPREQILVVTTDELAKERDATITRVLTFLGVDPARGPATYDSGEHNRTDELLVPKPWLDAVRANPIGARLFRRLPYRVQQSIGRERVDTSVGVRDADLRATLADLLRDDVARLRELLGPDFDGWGIA
jgi:hypothetical protein